MSGGPVPDFGGMNATPPAGDPMMPPAPASTPPMAPPPNVPAFTGMPLAVPMPPAPPMASVGGSSPMPPTAPHAKWADMLPAASAILMGIKNPLEAGAALSGYQNGLDRKRDQTLNDQQRQEARSRDAGNFMSDVMTHAAQFDDEMDLQGYLRAIKGRADFLGVDLSGIHVSDAKKVAKAKKTAQDVIAAVRSEHPDDILNPTWRDNFSVNGRSVADWYRVAEQPMVTDAQGRPVAGQPKPNALTPNTPVEQSLATFASEHGYGSFSAMPFALQTEARQKANVGSGADSRSIELQASDALKRGDTAEYNRLLKVKRDMGDAGRIPPTGSPTGPVEPLKRGTLDYQAAEDLASGKLTFQQFGRLYPSRAKNDTAKARIYMTARALNPDFNPADYEIGLSFAKNPQMAARRVAIRSLYPVIDQIEGLSSQVGNGDVQVFNRLLNGAKMQISNQPVVNFQQLKTLLGDEVGLALGVGSASDLKTKLGIDLVNTNLGDGSFQQSMEQLRSILSNREGNLKDLAGPYGDREHSPTSAADPLGIRVAR